MEKKKKKNPNFEKWILMYINYHLLKMYGVKGDTRKPYKTYPHCEQEKEIKKNLFNLEYDLYISSKRMLDLITFYLVSK